MTERGVLLIDWENLAGTLLRRGKTIEAVQVSDIWSFASRRAGGHLQAHMAAVKFDASIESQMNEHLIEREVVRSAKEQADILLTVLAMDYLNEGVRNFTLVTGDQDFVPLITRLRRDNCHVVVIYGDPTRLSPELVRTLATAGVESIDVGDVTNLRDRAGDTSGRSLMGLLELNRRGFILGGQETGERTSLLAQWGLIHASEESQYWQLIESMAEKIVRHGAAVRRDNQWLPNNATRTYLRISSERVREIIANDYLLRLLSSRPAGLDVGSLRVGPFRGDSGTLLDRCIDALRAVQIIREGADGKFAMSSAEMPLGYLEQLWRVYTAVQAETYTRSTSSIPFSQLEPLLGRRGVGQGKTQRSSSLLKETVRYAQAVGVIDTLAFEGKRHVTVTSSVLTNPIESAYQTIYREFSDRIGQAVAEQEFVEFMDQRDASQDQPTFGYDLRDRHRILRVLAQANLVVRDKDKVTLFRNKWGDALTA